MKYVELRPDVMKRLRRQSRLSQDQVAGYANCELEELLKIAVDDPITRHQIYRIENYGTARIEKKQAQAIARVYGVVTPEEFEKLLLPSCLSLSELEDSDFERPVHLFFKFVGADAPDPSDFLAWLESPAAGELQQSLPSPCHRAKFLQLMIAAGYAVPECCDLDEEPLVAAFRSGLPRRFAAEAYSYTLLAALDWPDRQLVAERIEEQLGRLCDASASFDLAQFMLIDARVHVVTIAFVSWRDSKEAERCFGNIVDSPHFLAFVARRSASPDQSDATRRHMEETIDYFRCIIDELRKFAPSERALHRYLTEHLQATEAFLTGRPGTQSTAQSIGYP